MRVVSKLGIRRGTVAEFLPSQNAPTDSLTRGVARIPGQEPPEIETFTFVADGSSTSYQVAGLNGDKIQLGVDIRPPGAVLREFAQDLLADCASDALSLSEFCVDGDAGTLRFGLPPVGTTARTAPGAGCVRAWECSQPDLPGNR